MSGAFYPNYRDGKLDMDVENFLRGISTAEAVPLQSKEVADIRRESSILEWVERRGEAALCFGSRRTSAITTGIRISSRSLAKALEATWLRSSL
jgi:hypothetical protein